MNFVEEYKKGRSGQGKGIPMGPGLEAVTRAVNGIQMDRIYVVASAPKVGKTTFLEYGFVIQPFLYCQEHNIPIEWLWFSFEIDRISIEFDFACFFLHHDYGIRDIPLSEGRTKKGLSTVSLSSELLRGRVSDDNDNLIFLPTDIEDKLKEVYLNRILPLFGEYDSRGIQVSEGLITVIQNRCTVSDFRKAVIEYATLRGRIQISNTGEIYRYEAYDKSKMVFILTDHVRLFKPEKEVSMKQIIDEHSRTCVDLRKALGISFVNLVHTNRGVEAEERLRGAKDNLYPTSGDVKDSGSLGEDASYMFTLFNPNDDRYRLTKHFGIDIKSPNGDELYPNMRTIHLVESRHCVYPQHFMVKMDGGVKNFSRFQPT